MAEITGVMTGTTERQETESEQEAPERKSTPGCHALDIDVDVTATADPWNC